MTRMNGLDGNAAAAPLREIFAADVTSTIGRCAGCGQRAHLAEAQMYGGGPGLVLRCSACQQVLARLVQDGSRTWLDLQGLQYLRFESSGY
ncbi:MAG: DUF6510 family protein [Jatrophihabitans sp.]